MSGRSDVKALFLSIFLGATLSACGFDPPADVAPDAGLVDATPVDASVIDPDAPAESADLDTSQLPHDFDDVTVGQVSSLLQVVIRNVGPVASSTITVVMAGDDQAHFEVVPTGDSTDCAGAALDPDATCIVQVRFAPDDVGPRNAQLEVTASNGGEVILGLLGNGLSPGNLEITAGATLPFGTVEIGSMSTTQTVTVRNNGGSATAALDTILGDESNYTVTSDGCEGVPLGASASCSVVVRFDPGAVGSLPTQVSVRESVTVGVSAAASGTGSARIQVSKSGSGTIASMPAGISCGAACSSSTVSFTQTPVTLTATEDPGYAFDGWTGACASANPSPMCQLALTSPLTSAGAVFVQVFTMTVSTTGSGTVTSAPTGIVCGNGNTNCDEVYETGTMVTLTAEPGAGWEVYAWGGTGTTCAALSDTCVVSMTQARNVTVEFRERFTLTVSPMGSGSGTVTGGGISCPGTCSVTVFDGTSITLTEAPGSATAGSQNVFTSWGGACSGSMTTCLVTVDAVKTVDATFTLQHRLSATIAGTGTGSVSGPGGFMCSSGTCSAFYNAGSTVALTPMAGASSSFDAFSGDCTGATCSITMSAPRAATASFRLWDCTPNSIVCNDTTDHYVDCSPTGTIDFEMDCPLGCNTGTEQCLDVDPSNGLASYLDMAPGGPDVVFSGSSTINTDTGVVFIGANDITATTPSALFNGIRVFWFNSLSVTGTLKVSGTAPLALVVDGQVTITGNLDVSADGGGNGPGAIIAGSCLGANHSSTTPTAGAGGGGRGFPGGAGGTSGSGEAGGAQGASFVDDDIVPLQGGCRGGYSQTTAMYRSLGGGGGGGLQITSRDRISITGSGVVDASGGGGRSFADPINTPPTLVGGGGGGSGGAVLLEAPSVILDGVGVVVSSKGGGGAAAGAGEASAHGSDGGTGAAAALGGTASGFPSGGSGGTSGIAANAGGAGTTSTMNGAGGGGAIGQARFNTSSGALSPQNGAAIRARQSSGTIGSRLVP